MIYADANPAQAKTYENLPRQRRAWNLRRFKGKQMKKDLNYYLNLPYVVIVVKDKNFDDMF